jgi:hypothetical protein
MAAHGCQIDMELQLGVRRAHIIPGLASNVDITLIGEHATVSGFESRKEWRLR